MANTPKLTVNGLELPYWARVSIDRSIDAVADTFTVEYEAHEHMPTGAASPLSFDGDEAAELRLGRELILTGYINSVSTSIDVEGTSVSLGGEARTIDLFQCPFIPGDKRFRDQSIVAICRELCVPFGIDVEVDESAAEAAATKLARFKVELNEDIADALARAARYKGLVMTSSPSGDLRLALSRQERIATQLTLPGNLTSVSITRDARERYSDYYVVSDDANRFDPDNTGDDGRVTHVVDPGVGRYRPLVVSAETHVRKQAQRRAQGEWERNRRAGQSLVVSCALPGWRHRDGLWAPNTLVRTRIKKGALDLDLDLVVTSVSLSRDQSSSSVQLELTHPAALEPEKVPLPRRRKARSRSQDFGGPDTSQPGDVDPLEEYGGAGAYEGAGQGWTDAGEIPFS